MQQKEYKYRVYPTEEQRTFFAKCFGCCRKIWNLMLADRNQYYKDTGKSLYPQPAQYKKAYPYLKEADSLALSNVQKQQNKAIKDHIENPKAFGVPKFKAKKRCKNSYTTNNQKGTVALVENGIKLPKVGVIRAVLHRMPEEGWTIKSATVSQKRDGSYYIFVLCEKDAEIRGSVKLIKKDSNGQVLKGVEFTIYDSDGNEIASDVTNNSGEVKFDGLIPDTYKIVETKTKAGNTLLKEPLSVTIPLTVTQTEVDKENIDTSKAIKQGNNYYFYHLTYEIKNDARLKLPSTGGFRNIKTYLPLIGGSVLILIAAYFVLKRKYQN